MDTAIRTANREAVRQFYSNNDPNGVLTIRGVRTTPLILAIDSGKYSIAELLIQLGANPNLYVPPQPNASEQAPLISAIRSGKFITNLLDHGANVNMAKGNALHYFLKTEFVKTNPELVQRFIEAGADVNDVDEKGLTPLFVLARQKKTPTAVFQALLTAGADISVPLQNGTTLFDAALRSGNTDMLKLILDIPGFTLFDKNPDDILQRTEEIMEELESEIDRYNDYNNNDGPPSQPPTDLTATYNEYRRVYGLLQEKIETEKTAELQRIKDILATAEGKSAEEKAAIFQQVAPKLDRLMPSNTLLQSAIFKEDLELVKLLIAVGVNINELGHDGTSAIEAALNVGNIEIVNSLLAAGVDINKENAKGHTATVIAVKLNNHDMLDFLLDHGADINNGNLLMFAIDEGNYDMVDHLLERGINVDAPTEDNETALTFALQLGHIAIAERLIAGGANVNISDYQYSPLHYAVNLSNATLVYELLQAGADIAKLSAEGETPLQIATRLGNAEIIEIFQFAAPPAEQNQTLWKGFTRGDAERFDTLFETEAPVGQRPPAENFSCCPVCLKYAERTSGCMYMTHNCSLQGLFHRALYLKYRQADGSIEWCTICGRIANGSHAHYQVGLWNGVRPPTHQGGNPFESDCRISSGGGGIPEKLMRARAVREEGLLLNGLVDQIASQEAYVRLVQASWNGPMTQSANLIATIISEKKWNKPSSNYPAPQANNNAPALNANDPTAYEQPTVLLPQNGDVPANAGYIGNNIALENDIPVIVFRHKNKDGDMHTHIQIGLESLMTHIRTSGAIGNICFETVNDCGGLLWPREIELAFADPKIAALITPEYRTILENYKLRFNIARKAAANAGAGAEGGRRKTRAKKVHRKVTRRQKKNLYRK